jgi:hypothetical protein
MTRECDDNHVVFARSRQGPKESLRDLCMRRGFIDQQARGQTFYGVGEQRPQRHRIAPRTAQLGNRCVQVLVDANENRFDCHAAPPNPIRARSCSITSLACGDFRS